MFHKKLNFKRSIISIWLISYIAVFALPVIGSIVMFSALQHKMLRQTENNNLFLLRQSVEFLDSLLVETERLSAELELNSDISDYTYIPSQDRGLKLYKLQEIRKKFASSTLNFTSDKLHAALYFRDIDMFLTRNSAYTAWEYYECFLDKEQSFGQWQQWLNVANDSTFSESKFIFSEEKLSDAVVYRKQIPYFGNEDKKISLFITYNMEEYLSFLHQIPFAQKSAVLISDKSGNQLFSFNIESIEKKVKNEYRTYIDEETGICKNIGNGYSLITLGSDVSGWKYLYFIPTRTFLAEYLHVFYIFIAGVIVISLTGIVLIAFLLKKNYLPVQDMMSEYHIKKGNSKNEFALIKDLISKNLEEKMKLTSTLEQQKSIVQKSYLKKLLNGELRQGEEISEALQEIDIVFQKNWSYLVLMITVGNVDDFFEGETSMDAFEKTQLINFMFENVLGELIQKSYTGYTLPHNGSIFCIIGAETVREETVAEMTEYAQKVFSKNFSIQFNAALSRVNCGYAGISEGSRQCIEAMEYRVLNDENSIMLYSKVIKKENRRSGKSYIEIDENFFAGLLEKGESKSAKKYMQSLFQQKLYGEEMSARSFRCMMYGLSNAFLHSITNIYRSDAKAELLQEKLIIAMDNKMSPEKSYKIFSELVDSICEDTGNSLKNKGIVIQIKEYIQANYSDVNLNINQLAEVFHLSSGYISNMFKKEENIGILDYIGLMRISKAKELLTKTDMTLEDIYLKVGFSNKSTFIRVFKKQTDMTPMQYRNLGTK